MFFFCRTSKNGYGAIHDPNNSENASTEDVTSPSTGGAIRRPVKKQSTVYCVHGNANGEDCCDNGSGTTTVNIKQMDSE